MVQLIRQQIPDCKLKRLSKMLRKSVLTLFVLGFVAVFPARASSVVIEYDLEGINQNNTNEASILFVTAGVSASTLTATSGLNLISAWGNTYPGAFTAENWPTSIFDFSSETGLYYSFTVTNNTEDALTLTGLTLALLRGDYGGSPGAESWALRTSQDNFESNVMTYNIADSDYNEQITFDGTSSGEEFASAIFLDSGDSVEFRLAGYYPTAGTTDYSGLANMTPGTYDHDVISGTGSNVILYGNLSSVPEPATLALLSIGGLLLKRRQRA